MADDDSERPSLAPPKLFGRKKATDAATPTPPADEPVSSDTRTFHDAGLDVTVVEAETDDEDEAPGAAAVEPVARPRRVRRSKRVPAQPTDTAEAETAPTPREPKRPGRPLLPGQPAAIVSGLVAGGVLVGLTWLGFRGCEAVRGTSSCGTGPGMVALIVIFVLAIFVGRFLLAAFKIPDPGATSFLAVGLTGVISLLFLVDVLDTWPMAIVIPAITAFTFLLSWWVTTTYVDGA